MGAGAKEKEGMPPRGLSIRRYASDEMSSVHLDDSTGGGHRKHSSSWPGDDDEAFNSESCFSFLGPFTGPVFGGESQSQLTTSWILPTEVFLAWRMIMFIYMIGTSIFLGRRGSLTEYPVSAEIYIAQMITSLLILIPCFLPKKSGPGLPRVNSAYGRHSRRDSPDGVEANHCASSGRQMLFTTATVMLQSAIGMTLFWDLVFWARLNNGVTASVDLMLLHAYNAMPIAVELLFGRLEFRLIYFLPAALFIGTSLGAAVQGKLYGESADLEWVEGMFLESSKPWKNWTFLMASLACSCLTVFALQRFRSCLARWLTADENEGFPVKTGKGQKSRSLPTSTALGRDASQKWQNC